MYRAHLAKKCERVLKVVSNVSSSSFRCRSLSILTSSLGRRRKIRCTYTDDQPNACKECRLRGSKCIDQESHEDDHGISASVQGDQRYSLRERVAHLENVVQDLAKRLDQQSMNASSPGKQPIIPFPIRPPYKRSNYLPIGYNIGQALI